MEKPRPNADEHGIGDISSGTIKPVENPTPIIRKTPLMLVVEGEFGQPTQSLLERMYIDNEESARQIGNDLGVSGRTVANWLTRFKLPTRGHKESLQLMWLYKKDDIVAKIHAGDSDEKRSKRQEERLEDPAIRAKQITYVRKAKRAQVANAYARRKEAFGTDMHKLYDLHQVQGLTVEEIGKETGFSRKIIEDLFIRYGIERTPLTHSRSVLLFQEAQRALWARPQTFQQLTDKEKIVFERRFLSDGAMPTLDQVAKELRMSKQGIKYVETRALEKIRGNE